jgi:hypothetical protein
MEWFMEYMENSIYGLMQTRLYYGLPLLKIGIARLTFDENLPIEF